MNNKHAYLIMAHNEFDILIELLQDIDDSRNDIYLHIDKKTKNYPKDKLCIAVKKSHLFFMPSMNVNWGGYSQIECELGLMQMAASNMHYDYYHLLTGVTFPIKDQNYIHQFFQKHNGMEFVGFDTNKDYSHRLTYIHIFNEIGKKDNYLKKNLFWVRHLFIILQKKIHFCRKSVSGIKIYKGLVYWSLTDDAIIYILSQEKKIFEMCKYSVCGDETFVQTILANSYFFKNIYNVKDELDSCMRMVKPSLSYGVSKVSKKSKQKENVISLSDIPNIIKCGKLFALKFGGPDGLEVIKQLISCRSNTD